MTSTIRKAFFVLTLVVTCAWLAGCGGAAAADAAPDSALKGVYQNAEGNASVEFMAPRPGPEQAGGRAHFSLHGVGGECTFAQNGRTVQLTCEGETTGFTIEDDGALTGPPDSFLTRLKKKE